MSIQFIKRLLVSKLVDIAREAIGYMEWKIEVKQMPKDTEIGDFIEVIAFGEEGEIYIYPNVGSNGVRFTVELETIERNYPNEPDGVIIETLAEDCMFTDALKTVFDYYYKVMLDNALEYAEFLKDEAEKGE